MRSLCWAAELAVNGEDDREAQLGVSQLRALAESDLLDDTAQAFVDAALAAVVRERLGELAAAGKNGEVGDVFVSRSPGEAGSEGIQRLLDLHDDEEGGDDHR